MSLGIGLETWTLSSKGPIFTRFLQGRSLGAVQEIPGIAVETNIGEPVVFGSEQKVLLQDGQAVPAKSLQAGDKLALAIAPEMPSWEGTGTFDEGWLVGVALSIGSTAFARGYPVISLRFRGEGLETTYREVSLLLKKQGFRPMSESDSPNKYIQMKTGPRATLMNQRLYTHLFDLGVSANPWGLEDANLEGSSSEFQRGILTGHFDVKALVRDVKTAGRQSSSRRISIPMRHTRTTTQVIQRMFLRFGVVAKLDKNVNQARSSQVVLSDGTAITKSTPENDYLMIGSSTGGWGRVRELLAQSKNPEKYALIPDSGSYTVSSCGYARVFATAPVRASVRPIKAPPGSLVCASGLIAVA